MNKKLIINIFVCLIIFCINIIFIWDDSKYIYANEIWISNLNEKNIKIKVKDIKVNKEEIKLNDLYEDFAIVTMEVENRGIYDMELSNIDIYPYQNNRLTKYFVTSCNENIKGFIGSLKPNDRALVKIGIALHNTTDPINLIFSNIESNNNEKVNYTVNIK